MRLTVGAMSLDGKLGDPEHFDTIVGGVDRLNADITILSEAYSKVPANEAPDHERLGLELGRTAFCVPYQNETPHPSDEQYMIALVGELPHFRSVKMEKARLATRNAVSLTLRTLNETEVRFFGVHFDDRNESLRRDMGRALLAASDPRYTRTIALGRLNSMHDYSPVAQLVGNPVVGAVSRCLPHRRMRSLATRLNQMAQGTVLRDLEKQAFDPNYPDEVLDDLYKSADPYDRATRGMTQLDHILIGQHKAGGITFVEDSFEVHSLRDLKNKAVKAEVEIHEDAKGC